MAVGARRRPAARLTDRGSAGTVVEGATVVAGAGAGGGPLDRGIRGERGLAVPPPTVPAPPAAAEPLSAAVPAPPGASSPHFVVVRALVYGAGFPRGSAAPTTRASNVEKFSLPGPRESGLPADMTGTAPAAQASSTAAWNDGSLNGAVAA